MVDQTTDLKTLTVVELKQELTQRQLPVDGKKADLTARLGPALEAEAAERERLREEEEKARLEEEERQRQLQLELELKEEAENADEGTPAAEAEQNGGDEEDYQEQYTEGGDTEGGTGSALAEETPGKSEARHSSVTTEDQDEWQVMEVPKEWKPLPLIKARGVSSHPAVTEADVLDIVEEAGYEVRSVHFEAAGSSRVAYIRLENSEAAEQKYDPASQGGSEDTTAAAEEAVKKLRALDPPPSLKGETISFDAPTSLNVEMFVANLRPEWVDQSTFRAAMDAEGDVIRCFVMCNPQGTAKGYGFVEFATPSGASKAKSMMDKIENEMRPDHRSRQEDRRGPNNRWQQIKLQRAEWTRPRSTQALFGRVLYVSNLPQHYDDVSTLRDVFEKYGRCSEVHLPRNKQTGNPKGFGFIEYHTSRHADGAYRGLQQADHPRLGKFLVSFANPAKPLDANSGQQGGHNRPQGGMRMSQGHRGHGGSYERNRGHGGGNRGIPPPRMPPPLPRGMPVDRGMPGHMPPPFGGAFNDGLALRVQQQQQDALQRAQLQRTMQMQMQMQQQQAQLQAQLRTAQMQAQAATQAAQQAQQQAMAAQKKAQAEEAARRKAEEDRKTALRAQQLKAQAAQQLGSYSQQYPSSSQAGSYYGSYSQGQGQGSARGSGQAAGGYGEGGYGAASGAGGGSSGGAGYGAGSAAEAGTSQGYGSGYGSMSGAGASGSYGEGAYGSGSGYNSYQQGYGGGGGGSSSQYEGGYGGQSAGYDAGYEQGGSGYGSHSGSKRDAGAAGSYSQYSQGYGSGSYGSYGDRGSQRHHDNKRQRY